MKKTVIIGLGSISAVHIAALTENGFGVIAGICDIDRKKIDAAKKAIPYEVAAFTDYREMLTKIQPDVVHICTPHYLHVPMCVDAMKAGADVYLEKPAAMNSEEGKFLLAEQKRYGKQVCVSFQNRALPTSVEAKRIIDTKELGDFVGARGFMTWKRTGAYYTASTWRGKWATEGGGVLMNQSIHTLDLLQYFGGGVGKTEGSVALRANGGITEVEDTAEALLTYKNGAHGVFFASDCNALDVPVLIELYFTNGKLRLENDKLYRDVGNGYEVIVDDASAVKPGKAVWGSGHVSMMKRFYAALDGAPADYCTLEDGLAVIRVIDDIYGGRHQL